jgi:hypothetical protein
MFLPQRDGIHSGFIRKLTGRYPKHAHAYRQFTVESQKLKVESSRCGSRTRFAADGLRRVSLHRLGQNPGAKPAPGAPAPGGSFYHVHQRRKAQISNRIRANRRNAARIQASVMLHDFTGGGLTSRPCLRV